MTKPTFSRRDVLQGSTRAGGVERARFGRVLRGAAAERGHARN